MKTTFSVLALCYIFSSNYAVAQQADSLNWFPHKTGDMWEYQAYDGFTFRIAQTALRNDEFRSRPTFLRHVQTISTCVLALA